MKYGLIGERLTHSFSAEIHYLLGGYEYSLIEVNPSDLAAFMKKRDFDGINVTIPYKREVMKYLDSVSPKAEKIGAVNTVVNRGGKLYGYNTDFAGMSALIKRIGVGLSGRSVMIAGTGGTSATAAAVADSLGAADIKFLSRRSSGGAVTYDRAAEECFGCSYLINTTPAGMYPNADAGLPLRLADFPQLAGVADAVYNPLRTGLVLASRGSGIPAEGGLYMLVAQAAAASSLFTGEEYSDGAVNTVYEKILSRRENAVLIGMSGSGKSYVGRLTAEKLGRRFIDTDSEIVRVTGKSVPEIFDSVGEQGFRKIESSVIERVSQETGVVIATGGGAVLKPENVLSLRRNGKLFYLDRNPEKLETGAGRPLAPDRESALKLYRDRKSIYLAAADVTVTVTEDDPYAAVNTVAGGYEK
ncbi:MAG: shikimate kinase [Clostridiales bacterium]|nr:shikimate kinase [Clostridiales bacterium]